MIQKISIPPELCRQLETAMYEYTVAKDNVAFLLSTNRYDADFLDSAIFKNYITDEVTKLSVYNKLRLEVIRNYLPADMKYTKWEINFEQNLLEVETLDE